MMQNISDLLSDWKEILTHMIYKGRGGGGRVDKEGLQPLKITLLKEIVGSGGAV